MKRIMWFVLSVVTIMINTSIVSYAQTIIEEFSPLNRDSETKITANSFQLIDGPNRDFGYDHNKALKWSNDNYPTIYDDFNEEIDVTNKKLRVKYLNRSEYYDHHENLDKLDSQFITVLSEPVYLYSNFSSSDFGINANLFSSRRKEIYDYMIKDTEYGIDHGYFKGTLTPQPLSDKKNEPIQIKLFVPAGTKVLRIGDINNPEYLLQREQSLFYQNKDLKLDVDGNLNIQITATLIDRKIISDEVDFQEDLIYHSLKNSYEYSNPVTLIPLGLNAGFILNESSNILETFFEKLNTEKYLDYSSDINYTMANGFWVHGNSFSEATVGMNFEERKDFFSKKFNITSLGQTATGGDYISSTILTLSFLNELNDTNATIFDSFMNTLFHEYFHYLIYDTDNFKNRKLFDDKEYDFLSYSEYLFKQESNELCAILDSDYAQTDPEEFMCESFMTKYHTNNVVKTEFNDNIKETNRFLDNLYDFDPPSSPTNLNEISVDGNNATLSFEHSSDNVSVDKYVIYKRKYNDEGDFQPCKTILTKKDENGLSSANPSDEESDVTVTIEQLEQVTEYEFYVIAIDEAVNESEPSNILTVKTKDTEPPNLTGALSGNSFSTVARLNWSHPTDNVGVSEVKIRRLESNNIGSRLLLGEETLFTVSGDVNYFTDLTVKQGKTYMYYMTALDEAGNESEKSNEVRIKISDNDDDDDRNKDKAENTSPSETTLNWRGEFEGISASGFRIFSWFKGLTGWAFGGVTFVKGTAVSSVVSLNPGLHHMFVVIPVDDKENPLHEGLDITVDAPSQKPTNLRYTSVTDNSVGLEWDSTDTDEKPLKYEIYNQFGLVDSVSGENTSYLATGLTTYTSYQFSVKAVGRSGESSLESNKVTVKTKPSSPKELREINRTDSSVTLAWDYQAGNYFAYFDIYQNGQLLDTIARDASFSLVDNFLEPKTMTTFIHTVTGLNSATEYSYTVKMRVNGLDLSDMSEELSVTTRPKAPIELKARQVTNEKIMLSWTAKEDPEKVVGYEIYQNGQLIETIGAVESYEVSELNIDETYLFSVRTLTRGGNNSMPTSISIKIKDLNEGSNGQVFGSLYSSFYVHPNGEIYGWGRFGKLNSLTPIKLNIDNVQSIFCNDDPNSETIILKKNGEVWRISFGENIHHPIIETAKVNIENVKEISGGFGFITALKKNGEVWSWGKNNNGQLGDGSFDDSKEPVKTKIDNVKNLNTTHGRINAGSAIKENGEAFVWGSYYGMGKYQNIPQKLSVQNVKQVFGDNFNVLALKENGEVWGFGSNFNGELGPGEGIHNKTPRKLPAISNIPNVVSISPGAYHTTLLTEEGNVWICGSTTWGEGESEGYTSRLDGLIKVNVTNAKQISSGMSSTFIQSGTKQIHSFGQNDVGRLGDGTTSIRFSQDPTRVIFTD